MANQPVQGFDPDKCRSLYVGNIASQVTEPLLYEVFGVLGQVENVKIIKDKSTGQRYGFVDYYDHDAAQRALQLNKRIIYETEIRVNWAFAGGHREDTSNHYHVFVGDLSPEIDDKALKDAFSVFGSVGDARVMWDQGTGRSRGYGFVAFREKEVAEQAIREMNGVWLSTRAIRVNWANQKTIPTSPGKSQDYETIATQASPMNTTVYIGGLAPESTENDLSLIFSEFGYIEEIRVQSDKGYAFVRFKSHDSAARAIVERHGSTIANRVIRCSWGKERPLPPQTSPPQPVFSYAPPPVPHVVPSSHLPPHGPVPHLPPPMPGPFPYPMVPPQYNMMPPYNVIPMFNGPAHPGSHYGPPMAFSHGQQTYGFGPPAPQNGGY